jgi:hypothetical protein
MSDENKRDSARVPVPAPLSGEVKVFQPMTILDVSATGIQIETPFPLQLDALLDFRISLGERSVVLKGRIAHCHIGELKEGGVIYRTGVEFVETSDHVQGAIVHFVEALKLVQRAPDAEAPAPPAVLDGEIAEDSV